ncbi:MAG: DUF2786 domain-containing protein [Kofleriaceae bacterium]|nr:DUF2786 domain-containing protein [Kofleriaceae bacterium]
MSRLVVDLEVSLVRELRRCYEIINDRRFGGKLVPPVLVLVDTQKRLGQWSRATRTLELSRQLVFDKPWLEVTSVLEHEMAHQFVDEVLEIRNETAHGPTFQRVCTERGIDARAAGAPVPSDPAEAAAIDRALDKIRKLLALAGSENQNEAEIAMQRAHALMLRYNIEQAQTARSQYEVRHLGEPQKRANGVEVDIMGLLAEFFFVEVIRVPVYVAQAGEHAAVYEVIGTLANVEMAAHVHAFLLATAERLWQENRTDARVKSGRDRLAYQSGVIRGFREKLLSERKVLAGTGLVWVGDATLDTFFRARYPRITRRRRTIRMTKAHAAGREAGRTVVLHKPVTQSGGSSGTRRLLRD